VLFGKQVERTKLSFNGSRPDGVKKVKGKAREGAQLGM
jgi:hypothetical protein